MASAAMVGQPSDPEPYSLQYCGHCLGEWLPNGVPLIADPAQEIRPLDLVVIAIDGEPGPWAALMNGVAAGLFSICKYYLGSYEGPAGLVYIVGQLAPPCAMLIPADIVLAMHKVVSAPGCAPEMSLSDAGAMDLVRPFANDNSCLPINPEWPFNTEEAAAWA